MIMLDRARLQDKIGADNNKQGLAAKFFGFCFYSMVVAVFAVLAAAAFLGAEFWIL